MYFLNLQYVDNFSYNTSSQLTFSNIPRSFNAVLKASSDTETMTVYRQYVISQVYQHALLLVGTFSLTDVEETCHFYWNSQTS